jgi:Ca2+-binding RTX toxin-like protein
MRLEFRAAGTEDSLGGLLDNIRFNETGISGLQDEWIPLEITSALSDTDESETLTVTVANMPTGAALSVGTDNGDGTWTLTADQIDNVMLRGPANDDGDFTLRFTATSTETANGDQASSFADYQVRIGAVADTPTISVGAASGDADTAIALDITAALVDLDGSETLSVVIGDVPAGATLSSGTDIGGGFWSLTAAELPGLTITPPAGDDADFTLSVTARATEGANGDIASTAITLPVTVNDLPVNQDPTAVDDLADTTQNTFKITSILGNDSDADGDSLSVSNLSNPSNGSVSLNPDNTVTYTPDNNFTGSDSFSYTIDDGNGGTSTGTVDVVVDPFDNSINGSRRADSLTGTDDKDFIRGRGGNDTISGLGDDDYIEGDGGNDVIYAGDGDDTVFGDGGNDTIYGGSGDNFIDGGRGRDTMHGGDGDDYFHGDRDSDQAFGYDGNDTYMFGDRDGDDTFDGGTGWTDAIVIENVNTGPGEGDWTLQLDQGSIVSQSNGKIVLSQDSAGSIEMDDGSKLDFSGVETLTW